VPCVGFHRKPSLLFLQGLDFLPQVVWLESKCFLVVLQICYFVHWERLAANELM